MAGNNPLVAEHTARDASRGGVYLWRDNPIDLGAVRTSAFLNLTGATNPIVGTGSGQHYIRWAANDAAAITFSADIPGDYNEVLDKFYLRLKLIKSTGGNTSATISGATSISRAGSANASGTVAPSATVSDDATPTILTLDFSGSSFKGKDSIGFTITPGAHDTCMYDLYGISFRYAGGLSLYNESDRYATSFS